MIIRKEVINFNISTKYKKIKNILLTFGGSYRKSFIKIFTSIIKINELKNLTFSIIFPNKKIYIMNKKFFKKKNIKVYINPNPSILKKTYQHAQIAVSAGGMQLSELMVNRINVIAIPKNNNEKKNIFFFKNRNLCHYVPNNKKVNKNTKLKILKIISNINLRKNTEINIKKNFDGLGSKRSAKIINSI